MHGVPTVPRYLDTALRTRADYSRIKSVSLRQAFRCAAQSPAATTARRSRLAHRLPRVDGFEEQDSLLDLRGEEREVHELGDPGAGEAKPARSVGLIPILAAVDGGLKAVREREHLGDPGRTSHGLRWRVAGLASER